MGNQITVTTEEGRDVDKTARISSPTDRTVATEPAWLRRGISTVFAMLKRAFTWHRVRADSLHRTMPPEAVQEKNADAAVWLALVEEAISDALLYLASEAHGRVVDALTPMGTEEHKSADSKTYLAWGIVERIADALAGLGTLQERHPDALVYFGTMVEQSPDAKVHFIHISDVHNIQAFLSEFIPSLWYSVDWGTVPRFVAPGGSVSCTYPPATNYSKSVLLLAKEIKAQVWADNQKVADVDAQGWALVLLPYSTKKCIVQNLSAKKTLCFFTWVR